MGYHKISIYDLSISKNLIASYEYILLPIYIFIFYVITRTYIELVYKDNTIQKYIYTGLFLKILGGLFLTLVFNFYYTGGDIGTYYNEGRILANLIFEKPEYFFRIFFYIPQGGDTELKNLFMNMHYMNASDTLIILKMTAFINLFTFNSYLITTFFFSYISFWCIWKLVSLLFELYPNHKKYIVWAFFFAPSLIVWGSCILKDTVCFSCLCLIHYYAYKFFIQKKIRVSYIVYILFCGYCIATIKLYILLAYIPCLCFMITQHYKAGISNPVLRTMLAPFVIVLSIFISYVLITRLGEQKARYSNEKILETAKVQREYIHQISLNSGGSTYDLGEMQDGILGYVLKIPAAINVSLFRPYIWEARNPIMILSCLESSLLLFITLRLLYKRKLKNTLATLANDPQLQFFLLFGLLFSFLVGVTSYNFGSLVRYKIQGYPFYIVAILLLYYLQEVPEDKKLKK